MSATSDSFARQMESAGLPVPEEDTASETASDDGEERLYQATKKAILREDPDVRAHMAYSHVDLNS